MKQIPVYVISGLLESGKTTFIKDTITSDDYYLKNKTLVLSGEEGEVEYEKEFLEANIKIVYFPYTKGISSTQISKALKHLRVGDNQS